MFLPTEARVNVLKHGLDSVDFNWEYPNHQGAINVNDTSTFLAFLQGSGLTVHLRPFLENYGDPLIYVSKFASVLDWINIMNYDAYSSRFLVVGPNSPVDDSCTETKYKAGSALSVVKGWNLACSWKGWFLVFSPHTHQNFRRLVAWGWLDEDNAM
ncbi:hypothetical protein J3A83DRAFT_4263064 [Scleroderma citrinum]